MKKTAEYYLHCVTLLAEHAINRLAACKAHHKEFPKEPDYTNSARIIAERWVRRQDELETQAHGPRLWAAN